MRILELCQFSAGFCGVWTRVKDEISILSKKHDVRVFSSNATKGSSAVAKPSEIINGVEIRRFPYRKIGGESFMTWDFEKEAIAYNPDVIIAHVYRHPHTTKALKIAGKIKAKVFLVTHAPFMEHNRETRSIVATLAVKLYDFFIGPRTINKFDKIITITKWEEEYVRKIGFKGKLEMIPNSVDDHFFRDSIRLFGQDEKISIIFFGRVAPVKSIETLLKAVSLLKKNVVVKIVGPAENEYLLRLEELVKSLHLTSKVLFEKPVFRLDEKIRTVRSADLFVLPSKREGMPQSLVEAMALGRISISSNTPGSRDIIVDGDNGFLFKIGDYKNLAEKIEFCLKEENRVMLLRIQKKSRKSVEQFKKSVFGEKLLSILSKDL